MICMNEKKSLHELWGYSIQNNPKTDYTILIYTIKKMVVKMKELPWPIYKIKLGTLEDIAIVTELRKLNKAIFRIDTNCSWTVPVTINIAIELKN